MVGLIVSFARELIESKLCGLRFLISHLGRCSMQWSEFRVPQHPSPWHLGRSIQSGPGQSIMWLLEVVHCTPDQQNTITASRIHISEGPRNTASSFEAFVTAAMENACLGLGDRKLLLLFSCKVIPDSATPWTTACQASLSFTISYSLFKLKSIELVMLSNHLIFCCPLALNLSRKLSGWKFSLCYSSLVNLCKEGILVFQASCVSSMIQQTQH